ncbi:MAG TPA: TetR family transcriptional regulator [Longimicrobiales bacterium]
MVNARTVEQKTAKAETIAAAALALQREVRFEDWTVSQVARRAGVAKGTVFLYYETKEALGLAVAQRLLGDWLDDLDRRLASEPGATTAAAAQAISRSLESRRALRRTIGQIGHLEHAAGRSAVEQYRQWMLDRFSQTGARLEARLSFLRTGEGLRLLLLVQALMIGYNSLAEPTPVVQAVLGAPALEPLRVDFRRAVAESVWMQLEGLRAAR